MGPKRFLRTVRVVVAAAALLAPFFVGLAGCGGGGGGGGTPDVAFSFAANSATQAEADGALTVDVVLHLTMASLTAPVTVQVADTGSGTATAGSDYTAFAAQTLNFPAGSVDGTTRSMTFTPTTDLLVEGHSETAVLRLQNPNPGAGLGGVFTATIEDSDFAEIGFATAESTTPDETNTARGIGLELELSPGAMLGLAVSVRIADEGTGSASSGVDYASFVNQTIVFPPGTIDGGLQTVNLLVLDDDNLEGDETVDLELTTPSAGVSIGSIGLHELTILDDDAPGLGSFQAATGPTGTENPLTYDQLLLFGSQPVGGGPIGDTLVRVTNGGLLPLELGAPFFSGDAADDFALEVDGLGALPLRAGALPAQEDALVPLVERSSLATDDRPGVALAVDRDRLAALRHEKRVTLHGLELPGLGAVELDLVRRALPLTPDCVLAVDGVAIPGGLAALAGDLQLWSGEVRGFDGSHVFLALSSAGARGYLALPGAPEPLVHVAAEPGGARLVGTSQAGDGPDLFCADPLEIPGNEERQRLVDAGVESGGSTAISAITPSTCRLALESDYQLYQRFNSTSALADYVIALVAAISDRYAIDVQTTLAIAYLGVHPNPNDGWDTQDSGGSSGALLNEFRMAWDGGWPVTADLAHFLSGADLGGGVAYLTALCSVSFGYGVSGNLNGAINWFSWNGQAGELTWDFVVVAHEIGHNFGARHTHSYCPPLDECSGNCNGTLSCTRGTLMSYCHLCGGMGNMDLYFHPANANLMRQVANDSCLGDSALAPGESVDYIVRFNPLFTPGLRAAALEIPHDAGNVTQPFRLQVEGNATP